MKKKLIAIILSLCTVGGIGTAIALSSNSNNAVVIENNKMVQEKTVDKKDAVEKKDNVKQESRSDENTKKQETTDVVKEKEEINPAPVENDTGDIVKEECIVNEDNTNVVGNDSTQVTTNEQVPEVSVPNVQGESQNNDSNFMAQVESMIFNKVNEERSKSGLAPLSYNGTMERYARLKSQDMGDRGYFDHNNLEGELITAQMQRDGVSYNSWGENIAYISGVSDPAALANQFMTNWMNSSGHRANILSSNFSSIGIGVYKIGNTVYATQEFYN